MIDAASSKNKTVMLIDDDLDFVENQKSHLETAGYSVVTATNAAKANELVKQKRPDVVVTELMLEYEDSGFCLCHSIKKLYADLPIIIVTAVASATGITFSAATEEERSWIKADVLLDKPIRAEQLEHEISKLLQNGIVH